MTYMNDDERKKWLAGLKPGDQVAVDYRTLSGRKNWHLLQVKYITKSRGRIDLVRCSDDDAVQSVGKDGFFPRDAGYYRRGIHPVTPQVLEDIEWIETSYKLSAIEDRLRRKSRDAMTLEQMKRLIALYKEVLGDEAQNQDQEQ